MTCYLSVSQSLNPSPYIFLVGLISCYGLWAIFMTPLFQVSLGYYRILPDCNSKFGFWLVILPALLTIMLGILASSKKDK